MPDPLLDEAARIRTRSGRTAEVVGELADRIAALTDGQPADEPTEADPRQRALTAAARDLAEATAGLIACSDDQDEQSWLAMAAVEQVRGLLDGAVPALVGGRSAAPTRDEIAKALYNTDTGTTYQLTSRACDDLAGAVLDLLSRSAAEPPEDAYVLRWGASNARAVEVRRPIPGARDMTGVAAEPNEEAGDGR